MASSSPTPGFNSPFNHDSAWAFTLGQGGSGQPDDGAADTLRLLEPQEVRRLIWEQVPLVDARSAQDYLRHHLPGAHHLPHDARRAQISSVLPDTGTRLIVYSNAQVRATALASRLTALDYRNVYVLAGGILLLLAFQDA